MSAQRLIFRRALSAALGGRLTGFVATATAIVGLAGIACIVAASARVGGHERSDLLSADPLYAFAMSVAGLATLGKSWTLLALATVTPRGSRTLAWTGAGFLLCSQLLLNVVDLTCLQAGQKWLGSLASHFVENGSAAVLGDGVLQACFLYFLDTLEVLGACAFAGALWRAAGAARFTAMAFGAFAVWSAVDLLIVGATSWDTALISDTVFALTEGAICVCAARQFLLAEGHETEPPAFQPGGSVKRVHRQNVFPV